MRPFNPLQTPEMAPIPTGVWNTEYKSNAADLLDVIARMERVGDVLSPAHRDHNDMVLLVGHGILFFYSKPKGAE